MLRVSSGSWEQVVYPFEVRALHLWRHVARQWATGRGVPCLEKGELKNSKFKIDNWKREKNAAHVPYVPQDGHHLGSLWRSVTEKSVGVPPTSVGVATDVHLGWNVGGRPSAYDAEGRPEAEGKTRALGDCPWLRRVSSLWRTTAGPSA